jgi:hypothetical protein
MPTLEGAMTLVMCLLAYCVIGLLTGAWCTLSEGDPETALMAFMLWPLVLAILALVATGKTLLDTMALIAGVPPRG